MWRYKIISQRGKSVQYLDNYYLYDMNRSLNYIRTSSVLDPFRLNNTTSIIIF